MKKILVLFIAIVGFLTTADLNAQTYSGSKIVNAGNNMAITIFIDPGNDSVRITMTGPDGLWYAYAFDNILMTNSYCFVTDGAGAITERKLANHQAGTLLTSSLTSSSHSSGGGTGTTIITRARTGMNTDYFTFPSAATAVTLIWAYGNGSALGHHAARGATSIVLTEDCINTSSSISAASACSSYTSPSGNYTWTSNGTYADTVANAAGCDSLITVNLTIDTATITPVGEVVDCKPFSVMLNAPAGNGYSYLWSTGATLQTITVTGSDSLTVTITDESGCSTTSAILATRAVNPRKLGPKMCGRMNLIPSDLLWAESAWNSPYSTMFQWYIQNKITLVDSIFTSPGRTLDLSTTFVEEGATYNVLVRLLVDGTEECWGDTCVIGTFANSNINPGTLISYDCDKPSAPRTAVIATLVQENGVTNAVQYEYAWYADANLDTLVDKVIINGRLCPFSAVSGITAGQTYYLTVRGRVSYTGSNGGGWGPTGAVCSVTPQSISRYAYDNTDSPDIEVNFTILAAPNPFDNTFNLHIDAVSENAVDVIVADITGRIVLELYSVSPVNTITMGSKLSAGAYYVRVRQGTKSQVVKLLKTN